MAGRGPAPKDPDAARGRHKERKFDELPAEGYQGPYPPLPKSWRATREVIVTGKDGEETTRTRVVQIQFLKTTRTWYEAFATSPMAAWFTAVDWQRLRRIAPLVDQFERNPSKDLAAELRLQETLLGATVMDRQRMRLRVARTDAATGGDTGGTPKLAAVRRLRAVDPGDVAHEPL